MDKLWSKMTSEMGISRACTLSSMREIDERTIRSDAVWENIDWGVGLRDEENGSERL